MGSRIICSFSAIITWASLQVTRFLPYRTTSLDESASFDMD